MLDSCRATDGTSFHHLMVTSRVSSQQGFDLDLGYRLLAVCAAHRDKLSPKSSALLSVWCEELGRLLLLRHQKGGPAPSDPNMQRKIHPPASQCLDSYNDPAMGWQQGGPGSAPQVQQPGPQTQQPHLSVVTTVWGVTSSTQSGPYPGSNQPGPGTSPSPYGNQQQGYGSTPGPQKPGFGPQGMGYRQNTPNYNSTFSGPGGFSISSGYGSIPGQGPGQDGSQYGPNQGQPNASLTAAALVAAAATATATATASVVALQERQQQEVMQGQYGQMSGMQNMQNQQYGAQYGAPGPARMGVPQNGPGMGMGGSQNGPGMVMGGPQNAPGMSMGGPSMNPNMGPNMNPNMGNMGNMGMMGGSMMGMPMGKSQYASRQRAAPYPAGQQYKQYKQQYPNTTQQPYASNPQYAAARPSFPSQYPAQQPLPSPTFARQQVVRQSMRPATGTPYQQTGYYPQNQMNGYQQFPGQDFQRNVSYQHSPIPGNPTPPLTPASGMTPYMNQTPDLKPQYPDIKPVIPAAKDDELRLTFPVRDGIVLAPFRLEHNLAVSNHVFHLKDTVHQTLMYRSDLELQLKCFHHEDRQMNTNWPASVTVSVNATPLMIDRGENKTSHKPLYLKDVCQPGRNTIQITVTACCCSHLFVLQLVHRPSVRSVLQGLLRKRLLPAEHCITKIKRNFTNVAASGGGSHSNEDGVEQTAIKVSLKCPITFKRITLPARGHDCKHIQCFDLESYLQLNCDRGAWRCPVCNKTALLEGLEVDQYVWGILTNLSNSDVEEVTIDGTASWKPVPVKPVKEEEADPCGAKRFKAMSPGSMTMPTMSNIDLGPGLSPYPTLPDMNAIGGSPSHPGVYGANSGPGSGNGFDFHSPATDFGPLSHLSDAVSAIDPLNAMEKTINEQLMMHGPRTPHTPHTPHTPGTPGGPLNQSEQSNNQQPVNGVTNSDPSDLTSDLNFDPAAVIDGEGADQVGLNLLPDNVVDPMELLSYLEPSELSGDSGRGNGTNSTGCVSGNAGSSASDDLLALFES